MNVFRSLARALWSAIDLRQQPRARGAGAPPSPTLRDGFERAHHAAFTPPSRGDGFDRNVRSAPVDLTGGVKRAYVISEELSPPPAIDPSDFVASLDDLSLLMGAQAAAQPEPASADEPLAQLSDAVPLGEAALAAPELTPHPFVPVPAAEASVPPPSEEGLLTLADFEPVVDAFEPGDASSRSDDAGPAAPLAHGLLTLAAFGPVVDAFEPAASPAQEPAAPSQPAPSQHTVELLMPAARRLEAEPSAVEHFSTVELFDVVAQLSPAEEPRAQEPGEPARSPPES